MNHIEVSTEVNIDQAHAWEYYFNQINGWWPKEYHTSPKTKRFMIQTKIGGIVYEDFGEDLGLIWGDVIGVDYPHSLQIRGNLSKEFGGPVVTYEKISFDKVDNEKTRVTYSCDFVGVISERSIKSLDEGWQDLIKTRFVNYCKDRANR